MHPLEVQLARCFSWFYRGENYTCNLCGFRSKSLKIRGHNYPVLKTKNVLSAGRRESDCRYCLSSDRDRLVWLYLSNRIAESHTILHVAPELPISKAIRNHPNFCSITYECIDKKDQGYFYPSWVKNGDVTSLSYPNNHFDIIIANHVLEHIPDLRSALAELRRVLKPSGTAIFMVPLSTSHPTDDGCNYINEKIHVKPDKEACISRFGQHDHVRLFGTDINSIFSNEGWQLSHIHPKDLSLSENKVKSLSLFPGEHLILGTPF